MDHTKHYSLYFLLLCLAASLVVVYFIIRPFFGPLILAAVFALLFQPLYQQFLHLMRKRAAWAALTTTTIAIILVLLPITLLGSQILKESSQLYQTLVGGDSNSFIESIENSLNQVSARFPIPQDFKLDFSQYARQGLEALIQNLGAIFSSFAKIFLNAFVFLASLYFFLKDGRRLKNYLVALSPLADSNDEFIVSRLKLAVSAAVKGNLVIGLIQGTLTGIGFALFGVPNAVLWGTVTAIAALLPGIGTALVIIHAIIFLFFVGNTFGATGLFVWGVTAVGLVDNFLGPKLIGRGMRLHPLAVFLAVLGGLAFFGPLGFLLGPLAMSLSLALIDIYFSLKTEPPDGVLTRGGI